LRDSHPKEFEVLCTTNVEFEEVKRLSHNLKHIDRVIQTNPTNSSEIVQIRYLFFKCFRTKTWHIYFKNIINIRFNPLYQINFHNLQEEQILDFYRSLQTFSKILTEKKNEYWIKLNPDQVLIFDNYRLLHGRSSIIGNRTLVTCYVNHDDFSLKLSKLNKDEK